MKRQRLDALVVARNLASTLKEAQAMIMAGKVIVDDQRIDKPGTLFSEDCVVRAKGESRFVSRGGEKLWGAFEDFDLLATIAGCTAIDVGSSTGGFSDCLLQAGAEQVVAIDVGTNQLAYSLRMHPKIRVFEQQDIRTMDVQLLPPADLIVADISFNSLERLADAFWRLPVTDKARYVLLVKPQFELEAERVGEGGIVRDAALQKEAVARVEGAFRRLGADHFSTVPSRVAGRNGNREHFLTFERAC